MSAALSPGRSRRASLAVPPSEAAEEPAAANPSRKRNSLPEPAAAAVLDPTPVTKEDGRKKRRKTSVATPAVVEPDNDYERQRAARIAANQERLQALNIDKLSSALQVKHEKERVVRGLSKAKTRRGRGAEAVEPRKSLRVQGMAPDGTLAAGIADERRDGTVVLASGGVFAVTETPRMTRPTGTLPFKSINGKEDTDAAFLDTLRAAGQCSTGGGHTQPTEALKRLTLAEKDVAKVCPKGITHMDFMPRDDLLLVAAGDKEGGIGLRVPPDVEPVAPTGDDMEADDDDGAADGVILWRPFSQYVSGVKWAKTGAQRLFACSYDGSVRSLDVGAGQWLESFVSSEQEWSSFDVTADGNTAYMGDNDGGVTILDMRSSNTVAGSAFSAHTHRVNCTSLEPGSQNMLATSASDATVCLWDIRKGLSRGAKPLHQLDHGKSCHGAYWAPQGAARVLTTSYNDQICIFGADGQAIVRMKHNNQTGKWLLPFRAIWTPAGDGVVVGSMVRETEVFSAVNGARIAHHSSEFLTAVPTRHACHQSISAVAAGTASGRVHVWRGP